MKQSIWKDRLQEKKLRKKFFFAFLKSLKKGVGSGVGSGSMSPRCGSAPKCHGSPTLNLGIYGTWNECKILRRFLGRKRRLPLRRFRTSGRRRHSPSQIVIDRLQAEEVVQSDHHDDGDHNNPGNQNKLSDSRHETDQSANTLTVSSSTEKRF
jgi:hypothetical protein